MLIVISPAKTLDYESKVTTKKFTEPQFLQHSAQLIEQLRNVSSQELSELMGISDELAALNHQRFIDWQLPFNPRNARQAFLAFNGDVYDGLDAKTLSAADLNYAQKHVRVLSGLYGLLRPLDLMQPYRLEMGTRFANEGGKDLYQFWGDGPTQALRAQLDDVKSNVLVNLASEEYFKVVREPVLQAQVVTPIFEDYKNGEFKVISFFAKRARGAMARYIVTNRLSKPNQLKAFDTDGYCFDAVASKKKSAEKKATKSAEKSTSALLPYLVFRRATTA